MSLRKKILIAVASLLVLFFLVAGLLVPEIIRRQAISWIAENTSRELTVQRVSFNALNGRLMVRRAVLSEQNSDEPFISFEQLIVNVNISSVWRQAVIIDQLELIKPDIRIIQLGKQEFNFSDFYSVAENEPVPDSESEPLQFAVNNLIVREGSLDYRDMTRAHVGHTVREFDLALPFLGNTPALTDKFVQPRLSLKIDDAPFLIEGEAKPFADTLEASLKIKLDDIDLPFYSAYLPKARPVDIESGKLSVDLDLSYKVTRNKETKLLLGGGLSLTGLLVKDRTGEKVFFLPLAEVHIDWADLLSKRAVIEKVAIYGMESFVTRDVAGEWNYSRLIADKSAEPAAPIVDAEPSQSADDRPHIELREFRFRNGIIHFRDDSGKKPFLRQLRDFNIDLREVDTLSGVKVPFEIGLRTTDPLSNMVGSISVQGDLGLEPLQLAAEIKIDKVNLGGIESYFPAGFAGIMAGGHIDSTLKLNVDRARDTVTLAGTAGLRALRLIEPVDRGDVLRWESLQLDGLDVRLADGPPSVKISELTLNNYLAKVLVTANGKVNLQHMLPEEKEEVTSPRVPEPSTGPAPAIRIDQITLQDGTFEFADQHMPKTFEAKFLRLGGRISGLDSASTEPATVDLRGNLENRSPLQITGGIQPLGESLFADLNIRFDSIELTPMTPYTGNYLGYAIEKGKLYLALDYKIDGEKLSARNNVFLDQFTFGQKVESEEATGLPVKLAVALLKDGQGEIHLDLPVSGSLDDPEFSVVGVVFTILKNLLVKAATSPFKLLGAMLGGGGEDFSTIAFDYGKAELPGPEMSKLARLADALEQRPNLKVEVSGYVDREKDPEGWRRTMLENSLKQLKYNALKRSGKLPKPAVVEELTLTEKERSSYLKNVYRKAKFPKPRNAFGIVKSLPDEEMVKLILANTVAGEEEMQTLADARAAAVHQYLVQVEALPAERVFLKQDDIYKKDDASASNSRVGFGATVD